MSPARPVPREGASRRRRTRLAVGVSAAVAAALGAGVVVPAVAQDATYTFEGRGFGHGVGMSQYGARGAALQGWDAPRILAWYYRGTTLTVRDPLPIRVLLTDGVPSVALGATGDAVLVEGGTDRRIPLQAGVGYTARAAAGGVTVEGPDGVAVVTGAPGVRLLPQDSLARVAGRRYRGTVSVAPSGGGLGVVNTVDSELYLQGVLPGEMPASWGDDTPAALQAQAVAARTYAYANLAPSRTFDLYDDTRSQVYVGVDREDRRANAAIAATRGRVLVYQGRLITAYYSSTSGGHTENVENSLGGQPAPYLRGVPDPFDDVSPLHRWPGPPTFTATVLGQKLRVGGPVAEFEILQRGVSPRVVRARVTTTDGRAVELSGASVKARLGLLDTWFWVRRNDRAAPAEPRVGAGAPSRPAPRATPRTPVARPVSYGYLVAAARSYRRAEAAKVRARILRLRPRAVILTRTVRGTRIHLVVTGRYARRADALRERSALTRRGYRAVVVAARRGDPGFAAPRRPTVANGPTTTTTPAPTQPAPAAAGVRFRVVASESASVQEANAVVARLGRTGRTPQVLSRWTESTGTRYLVVTLTGVTQDRARAERDALARLGLAPRIERIVPAR